MLPKEQLQQLEAQLKEVSDFLQEVSNDMIDGGFSNFPMYVAHQENAKIGEMIIDRTEFGFPYSINATTLERFVELGIVQADAQEKMKEAMGDPRKKCCILLLTPPQPQFVFHNFGSSKDAKTNG